jgi:hypothetical protein
MQHSKSDVVQHKVGRKTSPRRRNDQRPRDHKGLKGRPQGKKSERKQSHFSQAALFEIEVGAFKRLCKAVNTRYSNEALAMIDSGDWLGIANLPFPDSESPEFPDNYLIQQVMRKNPRLPIGVDRSKVAVEKALASEDVCLSTNRILRLCMGDYASPAKASLALHPSKLHKIRTTIKDILGPLTRAKLDYVEDETRFGPGASFHCSSKNLTANKKLESAIGLTPSLYSFVGCIEPHGWVQTTSGYRITAGSKATTVPKDALCDRFIAIEPSLNMRWQLGIGALIRRQLKRYGLNLKHQADKNRLRVRFAQATGLATIDLSSASDTIARFLIHFLLPKEWVHLLELFRSPAMLIDGRWARLEKFSSMGNGFTFELETLVFYAIAKAFDDDPYVFGDDIIVRQDVASDVVKTLNLFGFSVNGKKTFLAGSFFESCGSDFWHGRNVRPFFFKKDEHEDLTSAVIRMANAVRRYANRRNLGIGCDSRFLPTWLYLSSRCPTAKRTAVPEGYGDVGLVRDFDDATPKKLRFGHEGFESRTYRGSAARREVTTTLTGVYASLDAPSGARGLSVLKRHWRGHFEAHHFGDSASDIKQVDIIPLRQAWGTGGPSSSRTFQSVRGRIKASKLRTMPVSNWHELGPWL